ncbi:MAG: hypothetical protein H6713_16570 [Myxococcales bacterium]|nr:hypothetical protein [Myxococcales bacterium]MCB9751589.1 hypothetical protein [Myxococcales bacterium]
MSATSNTNPEPTAPAVGPYRWFLLFNVVMVLFIFAEPTIARLTEGAWKRGHFVFENTVSLDSHAAFGYLFVLLFVTQSVLGFSLLRRARLVSAHRALGRVFVFGAAPLFIAIGVWMILDRGLGLPPERTVVFRRDAIALIIELIQVMTLVAIFLGRGWLAIRRRRLTAHVDAMMAAFISAAMIAGIRLVYAVIWMFGDSPFTVSGVYFITAALTTLELAAAFALVGRLRENRFALALVAGSTVLVIVAASPWYSVWDT